MSSNETGKKSKESLSSVEGSYLRENRKKHEEKLLQRIQWREGFRVYVVKFQLQEAKTGGNE